jgi:hypothetical protein
MNRQQGRAADDAEIGITVPAKCSFRSKGIESRGMNRMSRVMSMDQVEVPTREPDVTVKPLVFDWNDPSEVPAQERNRILNQHLRGCWYVNPLFKVHCRLPTPEFLLRSRKCQRAWFRQLDRQFPDHGWRNKLGVTRDQVDRHTEFTGVLIIDGIEVDPENWNEIERILGSRPRTVRRQGAFSCLKRRDWEALRGFSRSELENYLVKRLGDHPGVAIFVTPGITVTGEFPIPAFYAEAEKRSREWHGFFTRELGNRTRIDLARQADWPMRRPRFFGRHCLGLNGRRCGEDGRGLRSA